MLSLCQQRPIVSGGKDPGNSGEYQNGRRTMATCTGQTKNLGAEIGNHRTAAWFDRTNTRFTTLVGGR